MVSKLEENVRKLIERGLMSPNAMKKKKYRVTYADGKQEEFHTSATVRKYAANTQKIEMKHLRLKPNPQATGSKNCFIVGEETEWKDVTARYKK